MMMYCMMKRYEMRIIFVLGIGEVSTISNNCMLLSLFESANTEDATSHWNHGVDTALLS